MTDVLFVGVAIGFFALCAAFVVGCDRIVRSDDDGAPVPASGEASR